MSLRPERFAPNASVIPYGRGGLPRNVARRWLMRAAVVAILVGMAPLAKFLWQRTRVLYWQHRCLNHVDPPGTVVYEEDPDHVASLLFRPSTAYVKLPKFTLPGPLYRVPTLAGKMPQEFERLFPSGADFVVFLHRRRSSEGKERLVVVTARVYEDLSPRTAFFDGHDHYFAGFYIKLGEGVAVVPAGIFGPEPSLPAADPMAGYSLTKNPQENVTGYRLFAGQPDPIDESRFTIRYEVGTGNYERETVQKPTWISGEIEGQLQTDGEVKLTVGSGPLRLQ